MRAISRVTAALAAMTVAAAGLVAAQPATAAGTKVKSTCANVVMMGARGSGEGEKSGKVPGFGTRNDDVAIKIAAGLEPGQTYRYLAIDYPAKGVPSPKNVSEFNSYLDSMAKGAHKVRDEVRALVKSCPSSRIVLMGYSQGAFAVHMGMHYLGDDVAVTKAVRSVVLLADPLNNGDKMRELILKKSGAWHAEHAPLTKGIVHTLSSALDRAMLAKLGQTVTKVKLTNTPILIDHTRTLSVCALKDPVCASGTDGNAHSTTYDVAVVATRAANFVLPTLKKSNGNGVCDAGELCAYDGDNYSALLTDWSANLTPGSISTFNISVRNDKTSSVWNRTRLTVTAVNEKVGRGDEKLTIKPAAKTNLTKVKKGLSGNWSNVVDHFDITK